MDGNLYNQPIGGISTKCFVDNGAACTWNNEPKAEPQFTYNSVQSPCPFPVGAVSFLPKTETELKEQCATLPVLPLSPDEVEQTVSTIVRDPSFATSVANVAQTSLLYDIQNFVTHQEYPELRNSRFHYAATHANLPGRKRHFSCDGDSEPKDELYWEKRKKNNESAKKSRDAKRRKEILIQETALILEEENRKLRKELATLREENAKLKDNAC